jgi:DNA-binding MarR family transcriptional regulator
VAEPSPEIAHGGVFVSVRVAKSAADLQAVLARLQRRLRAEVPDGGLTLSEAAVLGRLDRGGPATNSRLAASEHVRPQSMTATISSLEVKGLVAREEDLDDRRQILVSVTSTGRDVIQSMQRSRRDWLATSMVSLLSSDEQKLIAKAIRLLEFMVDSESPCVQPPPSSK